MIKDDPIYSKWRDRVLRLLSFRPRSSSEISFYLKRHKVPFSLITQLIREFKEQKLLDDYEFAKWFVEQRVTFRPKGKRLLTQELKSKGISQEMIHEVFSKLEISEEDNASQLVTKFSKKLGEMSKEEKQRKLAAYLSRRGFSWEVITKVMKRGAPDSA